MIKMFLYEQTFTTSEEYLEKYFKKYGKFRVQKFFNIPHKWQLYGTPNYKDFIKKFEFVNAREIFPDEIVIDIDADKDQGTRTVKKNDSLLHARTIAGRLKKLGMNYVMWDSGGDGYHIHLLFPEIKTLAKTDLEISWLKENILKYLVENTNRSYIKSKVCLVKKTLISIEHSIHRKGIFSKTPIEYFEDHPEENKIPKILVDRFNDIKEKQKLQAFKKYETQTEPTFGDEVPQCIRFFLEREIKDGRHRMLFILANYFSKRKTKKDMYDFINKWNQYVHNGHLTDIEIKTVIENAYSKSYRPGPRYYSNLLDDIGYKYVYESCPHCKRKLSTTGWK